MDGPEHSILFYSIVMFQVYQVSNDRDLLPVLAFRRASGSERASGDDEYEYFGDMCVP